jgi:EAL domain-containing protein (putative c-di-GMP-specific phosphodiesterase class I)
MLYQPVIALDDFRVVSMEALVRWQHPEKGILTPEHFINIAEFNGFIDLVDSWVIRRICKDIQSLSAISPQLRVSMNCSSLNMNNDRFIADTLQILTDERLPPQHFRLEISESILFEYRHKAPAFLSRLQNSGIRLVIDDFGTGYASLNYLKRFPVDCLKIDKSFIDGVAVDPQDAAITVATIDMAHALGLRVIAEGVETLDQRDFLRDHGCDLAQGFLYSPPIEQHAFHEWATQYQKVMQQKPKR